MSFGECEFRNEACPYYKRPIKKGNESGCFSDRDHIVPQRLAQTGLATLYIYSPENYQQLCRLEHDKKTLEGDEPLPDQDYMKERIVAQIALGKLIVSGEIKKRLKKGQL